MPTPGAVECLAEVAALEKKVGKGLTPVAAAAYVLGYLAGQHGKDGDEVTKKKVVGGRSIFVVDCGSGASRVYLYQSGQTPAPTKVAELDALQNVIAGCSANGSTAAATMQTFVNALAAAVSSVDGGDGDDDTSASVFVGATGGVRDAIHEKSVTSDDLLAFESELKAKVGSSASFAVLSGDDEARYEYKAVRYAVKRMLTAGDADAGGAGAGAGGAGEGAAVAVATDVELTMVSLGGASLQMASATSVVSATAGMRQVVANDKASAFKTLLKEAYASHQPAAAAGSGGGGGPITQAAGVDAAQKVVGEWSKLITTALAVGLKTLRADGTKLSGRIVGISTTFWAAKDCGIAERLVSHADAVVAADNALADLFADAEFIQRAYDEAASGKKTKEKPCEHLSRVAMLKCILSTLVSDTSTLLFKRSWEEGTPEAFVTNYPAGKFLELDGNNGIEE